MLIHQPVRIARKYGATWFPVDFLSTVPYAVWECRRDSGYENPSGSIKALKLVKIFRLARLLKLMRAFKGIKLLKKLEVEFALDYNLLEVAKFSSLTFLYAHWMGCAMGITANMQDDKVGWCRLTPC